MPAPAVNVDVIDSRDKNWDLRTAMGAYYFITLLFSSQNNNCDVVQSES